MSTPLLPDAATARRLLALTDLTRLGDDTTASDINALCQLAANRHHAPAALCVPLPHVAQARGQLDRLRLPRVAVATVVNFPDGGSDLARVEHETAQALAAGADEIDAVMPYRALQRGDLALCRTMLERCRALCGGQALLKIIIESGELADAALIADASRLVIDAGADFIKTSTGMTPTGATLAAADVILHTIRDRGTRTGFKASGGIRTFEQACAYLDRAAAVMGDDWIGPARLRIGASSLVGALLAVLEAPR